MGKKRKNAPRHAARECAFQILYALSYSQAEEIEDLTKIFCNTLREETTKVPAGFAWELVKGVWTNLPTLDETIQRFSQNWKMNRIGRIELIVLRLAVFELLFCRETPPPVVISESLDLSSKFGEEATVKFINGILTSIAKEKKMPRAYNVTR